MPVYEFRCGRCDSTFEVRRPMAEADASVLCPQGHAEVRRVVSLFAAAGRVPPGTAGGGGCCGGSCGCR